MLARAAEHVLVEGLIVSSSWDHPRVTRHGLEVGASWRGGESVHVVEDVLESAVFKRTQFGSDECNAEGLIELYIPRRGGIKVAVQWNGYQESMNAE